MFTFTTTNVSSSTIDYLFCVTRRSVSWFSLIIVQLDTQRSSFLYICRHQSGSNQRLCGVCLLSLVAPDVPTLISLNKGNMSNTSATVEVKFQPPQCILMSDACLDSYIIQFRRENATTYMELKFNKKEATTVKQNRIVSKILLLYFALYFYSF